MRRRLLAIFMAFTLCGIMASTDVKAGDSGDNVDTEYTDGEYPNTDTDVPEEENGNSTGGNLNDYLDEKIQILMLM